MIKKMLGCMAVTLLTSCSEQYDANSHITFGGIIVDGSGHALLEQARSMGANRLSSDFAQNLELQVTSVSDDAFKCVYHGSVETPNILWFEVFPGIDPLNNIVCSLEARSILNDDMYHILLSSLKESLGTVSYDKKTYNDDLLNKLDGLDPLAYLEPSGEAFYIWVVKNGYVVLQLYKKENNNNKYVILNVVDKTNFKNYLMSQLEKNK